ncbi:MAG: CHAT domain-containing tetratricopeptide repeat protein [Chitinophagaceae bacterium]
MSTQTQAQSWKEYLDSAELYRKNNDFEKGIFFYEQADKSRPTDSIQTESNISLLTQTANFYYLSLSQYEKAKELYLKAKTILSKIQGRNNDTYGRNAFMLGQIYYKLKDVIKSEEFYFEAKQIWQDIFGKNSKQYAAVCNALGILYNDNGDYEKAELQHFEARAIRKELKDSAYYAQSCNNLAAIYWNLGQPDKAEPLALEAKEIRGSLAIVPKPTYAISCVNLANIYRDMGKYEKAEALYIEAKNIREKYLTKDNDEYALSCDILADLYYFMKQYDKAEPLYIESKAIREKIGSTASFYYGQSCSNMAALYREMGKYEQAQSLALKADMIYQSFGNAAEGDIAINYNSLGVLFFAMKKFDKAEEYLGKARIIWKKNLGEEHPFYTENSLSLARVNWQNDDIQKANELYVQAFDAQVKLAGSFFSFTSEEEKQLYLKNIAGSEDEYQSFYFQKMNQGNGGQPYQISLLKRNQILASSQEMRQLIYDSRDTLLTNKYAKWVTIKKQIATLYAKGESAPKDQLQLLLEKADVLEKDIVRSSKALNIATQNKVDWKLIRNQLGPTEAAIEFIEFNYFDGHKNTDSTFYVAQVLRKGMTEPAYIPLFEKHKLDSLFRKAFFGSVGINQFYTRGLELTEDNSYSQQAYNTIWKPMENQLAGLTKIYYAPAGLLHRISFAALAVDSAEVLSDKYQLVQLSTTASIPVLKPGYVNTQDKILLYGGVQYNRDSTKANSLIDSGSIAKRSGFNYLPGTEKEVDAIATTGAEKKYTPVVLKGWLAKEDSVKVLNGIKSPAVIHIATHGFFFDDPESNNSENKKMNLGDGAAFQFAENPLLRSGLLFAGANDTWKGKNIEGSQDDGILTAYEVSNLYLPNTRLVVLSACETALGDIKGSEGVYGLQRAFKMAGVKNLVMSLWKVPDIETAEFMQLFYKNMFEGKAIDQSFYETQMIMKNKYRNDPYKWAAWILLK